MSDQTHPSGVDQLIDHAASLQQQVDQLARELLAIVLLAMALAAALALHVWRTQ